MTRSVALFYINLLAALLVAVLGQQLNTSVAQCPCAAREPASLASAVGDSRANGYITTVERLLQSQCDLVDPLWCYSSSDVSEVDFIVVGAGSAGSIVASRLSEISSWDVALLEAGGPEPTGTQVPSFYFSYIKSPYDWDFALEREPTSCLSGTCYWPRGKSMGGTGILHGMMYMRGNRYDYDMWAQAGNKGWSFADVFPYFLKSEDNGNIDDGTAEAAYHGRGGLMRVERFHDTPLLGHVIMNAAHQMGYDTYADLNGRRQTGFTIAQATNRDGARLSSSKAFIQPFLNRTNLHIIYNAMVLKVLINENKTAYGVQYVTNGKTKLVLARKEVILSAGAVMSPKVLLHSGVGPAAELQKIGIPVIQNLPKVGKELQNHVSYTLLFTLSNEKDTNLLNNISVVEYLNFREGPMSSTGMSQVTGFISTRTGSFKNIDFPTVQIFFGGFQANYSRSGYYFEESSPGAKRAFSITPTLLRPESRGEITLYNNSFTAPPKINANYLSRRKDISILIEGIRFVLKLASQPALNNLGVKFRKPNIPSCNKLKFGTDAYWECAIKYNTNPENHQVGTSRMGTNANNGVVNQHLQVYGIKNLRVIDASIMPNVTSGNVNAPIMMIAEKGSDYIKSSWISGYSMLTSFSSGKSLF